MKKTLVIFAILLMLVLSACEYEHRALPTSATQEQGFGANDTSYIELQPVWDASVLSTTLDNPRDLIVGPDGLLFLADQGNHRIVAFTKAGQVRTDKGFDDIAAPHPEGLAIDSKLNLLIANQTDTLYAWNQYLNVTEIDSVADTGMFENSETHETSVLTFQAFIDATKAGESWELIDIEWKRDQALEDAAQAVYPMFVNENPAAEMNGVAAGPYGSDILFVTESSEDKITELRLIPDLAVKTTSGSVQFRYQALVVEDVATFGSGAGTVDDPWSIYCDQDANVYFSQMRGNFRVQKLTPPAWEPGYVLYQHEIMDLDRFREPTDITLDDENKIFVVDAENGLVSKFHNSGSDAGNVIDLGERGLALAQFDRPSGILATDRIVYVVEAGQNRIRRFQYSVSDEDLPDDDKKP